MTGQDPDPPDKESESSQSRDYLQDLKARLASARARERHRDEGRPGTTSLGGVGIAIRVGIELVGTLAVGVGIGWLLDRWLGTGPWLLVVFFFLGSAAGVLNAYRAVQNIGLQADNRRGFRDNGEGGESR